MTDRVNYAGVSRTRPRCSVSCSASLEPLSGGICLQKDQIETVIDLLEISDLHEASDARNLGRFDYGRRCLAWL